MDRKNWDVTEIGAVRSDAHCGLAFGVVHPHQESPLWIRWIDWFLDSVEVMCPYCKGRGDVSKVRCDHCEGQGRRLSDFGEKILHAHEFFERLQERIRYRRSRR